MCTVSQSGTVLGESMPIQCLYSAHRLPIGRKKVSKTLSRRMVQEDLQRLGWPETDLRARPKGHRGKVPVARRLRQETTMSLKWIAARLQMGSWTYVSNLLNEKRLPQTNQGMLFLCQ